MTTNNSVQLIEGLDGDAVLTMTGDARVEIRMTRDTDNTGWVSWDHHPRKLVKAWVKQIRSADLTADEAQCNDDPYRAFLYVGGEA